MYCYQKKNMEVKKSEIMKDWLRPKSIQDFQIFLSFSSFYQQFIKGFHKITILITSMLKTTLLFYIFVVNGIIAIDKFDDVKSGGEVIKKSTKQKRRKLSKSQK